MAAFALQCLAGSKNMDEMWGGETTRQGAADSERVALFRDGNYGMFIHWGLYSKLAGKWEGKTYYGIGEWIMNPRVAGIPPKEYMKVAADFNPSEFDARYIARVAKEAGMKWIIITSKHHEGFAMFKSEHPFNIVDASPFKRDPMKELAEACEEFGLGFGFYYSHNQDWTAPGGSGGPKVNEDGTPATFAQYFEEKCFPQVKEICTQYGDLDYIWFDTPGNIPKEYAEKLARYVAEVQPNALLCSRIGHGMGDYASKGDMDVPVRNADGLWESCDTTNDSWSYAWYDSNWKDAHEILKRVVSTVARGGTYLLNIGPDGSGRVPEEAVKYLLESGRWIQENPSVVYGADPSPWGRALPWGDVTVQGNTLNLVVFDWPDDELIYLPGLRNDIKSAKVVAKGKSVPVEWRKKSGWVALDLADVQRSKVATLVQVELSGAPEVDQTLAVLPNSRSDMYVEFAEVENAVKEEIRWMEKFGEWKHMNQVSKWSNGGKAVWTVDVAEPGDYYIDLTYKGTERLTWRIEGGEGRILQNNQNASHVYHRYPMGLLRFDSPGRHTLSVSLVDGNPDTASLSLLSIRPTR
ncbi:alpha-L-fucosidase [Pelagicoccus sp. SDUM812005]|uniref:alpha-L-fucosidase n=1 Tax=Pelagicoccus sp. SDUM812005 TaxID=3041257 RepID=UPI002810BE21|nr:alpha-L-fucosidase [Pelagicoccus sp. SDUM812005]